MNNTHQGTLRSRKHFWPGSTGRTLIRGRGECAGSTIPCVPLSFNIQVRLQFRVRTKHPFQLCMNTLLMAHEMKCLNIKRARLHLPSVSSNLPLAPLWRGVRVLRVMRVPERNSITQVGIHVCPTSYCRWHNWNQLWIIKPNPITHVEREALWQLQTIPVTRQCTQGSRRRFFNEGAHIF